MTESWVPSFMSTRSIYICVFKVVQQALVIITPMSSARVSNASTTSATGQKAMAGSILTVRLKSASAPIFRIATHLYLFFVHMVHIDTRSTNSNRRMNVSLVYTSAYIVRIDTRITCQYYVTI